MAIVPRDQKDRTLDALVAAGFTATFSEGRGGVMRQAYAMLFIAVDEGSLQQVLALIRGSCRDADEGGNAPLSSANGGAIVFVWRLDQVETY